MLKVGQLGNDLVEKSVLRQSRTPRRTRLPMNAKKFVLASHFRFPSSYLVVVECPQAPCLLLVMPFKTTKVLSAMHDER